MRTIRSGNFWIGVAVGAFVVPWVMGRVSAAKPKATAG